MSGASFRLPSIDPNPPAPICPALVWARSSSVIMSADVAVVAMVSVLRPDMAAVAHGIGSDVTRRARGEGPAAGGVVGAGVVLRSIATAPDADAAGVVAVVVVGVDAMLSPFFSFWRSRAAALRFAFGAGIGTGAVDADTTVDVDMGAEEAGTDDEAAIAMVDAGVDGDTCIPVAAAAATAAVVAVAEYPVWL